MKKFLNICLSILAVGSCCFISCTRLSDEAKTMVGKYYISELSDDVALMELNGDGSAVYRTIKPEVLTISVKAKWNVVGDSIVFDNDLTSLTVDGDSTMLGNVPGHISKHLVAHDDFSLTIEQSGVQYVYHRR